MYIKENVTLSDYSSYKIGGPARYFVEVRSQNEITEVLNYWKNSSAEFLEEDKKILVLGGGTNILFPDGGFSGLVVYNNINFIKKNEDGVEVGAGTLFEKLLEFCIEESLKDLEWAGGLPGTVGGAIRGNAGAFGGEIKDSLVSVTSIDLNMLEVRKRENKECGFGYRRSIFKNEAKEIILSAEFALTKGDRKSISEKINYGKEYRKERHPSISEYPNLGSTFKNIPVENVPRETLLEFKDKIKNDPFPILPTVKLIAGSGMTGARAGDIVVSDKHPNYMVNLGGGSGKDARELIEKVKKEVKKKYNVEIEEEITILN